MNETKVYYENATEEQRRTIETIIRRDLGCCQSALIDMLLEKGDVDGFTVDEIINLTVDPSEWSAERCKEYLDDNCGGEDDYPCDSNPFNMDMEDLQEAIESLGLPVSDDEKAMAETLFNELNDEDWGDVDDWRQAVNDAAEPQDIMEWWPINDNWTKEALIEIGEPVLSNDYGDWWGRTCSGQSISLDPTFWKFHQRAIGINA